MRFTANRKDLLDAVNKASQAISSRTFVPIMESVLCEVKDGQLTITGSDMEVTSIATCKTTEATSGAITIPAKRLSITLRQLAAEQVTIYNKIIPPKDGEPDDLPVQYSTTVVLETETGEYTMTGESAKEYPVFADVSKLEHLDLDADICKVLARALSFVSTDELRPAMMGVLIESDYPQLIITATDGHRLYSTGLQEKAYRAWSQIIPIKGLQLALKNGATRIDFGADCCIYTCPGLLVRSRMVVDEQYPNYNGVIPPITGTIGSMVFRRTEMIERVKRVLPFASATTKHMILEVEQNEARFTTNDFDFGGSAHERMRVTFIRHDESDASFMIGLNGQYLLDILGRLDSEYTTFHLSGPTRAILINTELDGERLLLMPCRIESILAQEHRLIPAENPPDPIMQALSGIIAEGLPIPEANILPQCPNCEAAIDHGIPICPNCSVEINWDEQTDNCIDCGAIINDDDEFYDADEQGNGMVCLACGANRCQECFSRIEGTPIMKNDEPVCLACHEAEQLEEAA